MQRAYFLLRPLVALAICGACAPIDGPVTVEALVHDPESADGTRLGDVVLTTITDLTRAEGELFSVRGGLRMAGLTVQDSVDANDTYDEMIDRCRGDGGHEFWPRMSFDGERYLAEDLETLTAFTVFGALEKSYALARDIGDEDGSAPGALVGITSEVVAADLFPLPLLTSDNAAYAPPLDGWLTLRIGLQQGVPFAMSLPVLAHEFGHRLFFKNSFRSKAGFEVWRTRLNTELDKKQARSNRLLQGVDEGLADLFSLGVTGDREGIPRAFRQARGVFEPEGDRRDVEGVFATEATYDGLNDLTIDAAFLQACGASTDDPLFEQPGYNFYCLGTVVATALWDGSDRDPEILRTEVLPAVVVAMRAVGDRLAGDAAFEVDFFLEPLAAALPEPRRGVMCASIRTKFTSLVTVDKVPSCP